MQVFGQGWDAVRDDIGTFCKLLNLIPSPTQMHYLLRVKNNTPRLGLHMPSEESFPIIATSMLWRALCFGVPSICLTENKSHGEDWIKLLAGWISVADGSITSKLVVSEGGQYMTTLDGTHICHVISPFTSLSEYGQGQQDILLLDFDDTPGTRMQEAFALAEGALMYLPTAPSK